VARLVITGKISNSDGTPIPGIQVTVKDQNVNDKWPMVVTDSNGDYQFSTYQLSSSEDEITITATDTDGAENGGDFADAAQLLDVPAMTSGDTNSFKVDFTMDAKP
jgi:putative lipoprotein (rSAM/lipoprotein system)